MATQLFLRNSASDLGGAGQKALSTSRGAASVNKSTNTVTSGNNLQVTDTSGGQTLVWLSSPLNAVTITGNITVNIRGWESATAANAAAGILIERVSGDGTTVLATIVPITSIPATANEYTTTDTAKNASVTPTSTPLSGGDRIRVTLYVRAAAGTTMGGGRTAINSVDGPTAGATGDSYVTFTENLTNFSGVTAFPVVIAATTVVGGPALHAGALASPQVLALTTTIPTPARPLAAFVKGLGTQLKPAGSTQTVLTLASGIGAAAGNRIIIGWGGGLANQNDAVTCDDSKGNTYSLYRKVSDAGGNAVCALFSAPIQTALVPGDTITVTQSQSTGTGWLAAEEWNNLTIPAQTSGATGTSTSAAAGSVTMEAAAGWFGILTTYNAGGTTTGTLGAPWTARRTGQTTSGTPRWFGTWDRVEATGATLDFAPSLSASASWAAGLMALTSGTEPPTATLIYSWVGGITTTSVTVTAHTNLADPVRLVVSLDPALGSPIYGTGQSPDASGYTRHTLTGLSAGTQYYYGLELNGAVTGQKGQFKTAPAGAASFTFAIGSCAQTQTMTSFTRALARSPDMAIVHGDFPYADITSNSPGPIRDAREALLTQPAVAEFIRKIPVAYTWSDHDFGGNNSNTTVASKPAAQTVYRQQVPHHTLVVADGIYHSFVYGRIRFILTDNRSFKSLQTDTDNSSKTVLGATQKTWFKNLITSATEPLIVWVNEQPWIGTAGTGDDEWSNYSTERTELGNYIAASGKRVIIMSGDMHAVAYDNGGNSAGAIPVFHSAPWWNNASQKGGPYSSGPFPASGTTIVQQYGIVTVTDTGTALSIRMRGYDSADTVQVDATISLLTPNTITATTSIGTVGVPTPATVAPQRIACITAMPAADATGDEPLTQPDTIVARVYMGADIEPPTVPTGLHQVTSTATTVDMAWNAATDNVAVAFYELVVTGPA